MRRPDGVVVIAAYEFITGFLDLCVGYIALWIAAIGGATASSPWWPVLFWGTVGVAFFIGGGFSILVGIGLLRMRDWARWGAIVLALLALPVFPIGTVIGALILWYLMRESTAALFRAGLA
ncbi:MAG: hypothetical protein ACYC5O_13310 [Anaerolineae bacterium]